jgi:hypothetical protein
MTTGRTASWEQWDANRDRDIQPTPRRQEQVDQWNAEREQRAG